MCYNNEKILIYIVYKFKRGGISWPINAISVIRKLYMATTSATHTGKQKGLGNQTFKRSALKSTAQTKESVFAQLAFVQAK